MTATQVYRVIVALDIEQFSRPDRDELLRVDLRRSLRSMLGAAFDDAGVAGGTWTALSTGDGLLVLVDPTAGTARVLHAVISGFADRLAARNRTAAGRARLRVRAVVHAGHLMLDEDGAVGEQVNLAFRLLDTDDLRRRLRATPAPLVVAVSSDVYGQVVRHRPHGLDPASFRAVAVHTKETTTTAWIHPAGPDLPPRRPSDPAFERHWEPRARGVQRRRQPGWHFTGRVAALRELVTWLANPDRGSACVAITGDPGSGKSAVLARLVTLAQRHHRPQIPAAVLAAAPAGTIPPPGSIHVALHAAGKPPEQVTAELAAAVGAGTSDPHGLVEKLLAAEQDLVVAIDALDEAAPPEPLVRDLLRPLILERAATAEPGSARPGRVRLLVAARRQLLTLLPGTQLLDLDTAGYLRAADLAAYAERLLHVAGSPYRDRPEHARAVAAAIAGQADRSFLIAQLAARALAAEPAVVDTRHAGWRRQLPDTVGAAMDRCIAGIPEDERRVRDLLRPLAWAEGDGLADDDLWAAWATALGTAAYRDHDVRWVRTTAAGNLLQPTRTADGPAYRLFHTALAQHLRAATPLPDPQRPIARLLHQRVPPAGSRPRKDWLRADPYTRTHLATHAASSPLLGRLVTDPRYLTVASPSRLARVLAAADLPPSVPAAVYTQVVHLLSETDPGVNAAHLEFAARVQGRDGLARRFAALRVDRRWRVPWVAREDTPPGPQPPGHAGSVRGVAAARLPGGRLVVVSGGDDGVLLRWTPPDREPLNPPLRGHTGMIRAVATAVLPDGRAVAVSGSVDQTVRVWDLVAGGPVAEPLRGHVGFVRAVAATRLGDRALAVSGGQDGTVRVWDLLSGAPVGEPLRGHAGYVRAVTFARLPGGPGGPGRVVVASAGQDGTVRVWDPAALEPLAAWPAGRDDGHVAFCLATAQLPGGPVAVTGGRDGTVRVWDLLSGAPVGEPLRGHAGYVRAVAAGPVGGRSVVASGSQDGTVMVWDLEVGQPVGQARRGDAGHVEDVTLATRPDGREVAISGSENGLVTLWALAGDPTGDPNQETPAERAEETAEETLGRPPRWWRSVTTATLSGRRVAVAGGLDGTVSRWDFGRGRPLDGPLRGHDGWVSAVTTGHLPGCPGRPVAVSGSRDGTVRAWDLLDGVPLGEPLRGHTSGVRAVSVLTPPAGPHRGRLLAVSGSRDGTVRAWDVLAGTPVGHVYRHPSGQVMAAGSSVLPDGRVVATVAGAMDPTLTVWDVAAGVPVGETLRAEGGWIRALATGTLPGNHPVVVAATQDSAVLVWDLTTGRPVGQPLRGHSAWIWSLATAPLPDGRLQVASGGSDGTVQVWTLPDRVRTHQILLGTTVYGLAIHPPDALAVATAQGLLRLDLLPSD